MDKFWMTDRKTTEAALILLELQKGDMGRTKVPPKTPWTQSSLQPSTSSTTNNTNHITVPGTIPEASRTATPEDPKTPHGSTSRTELQPGPYPTPDSSAQHPSRDEPKDPKFFIKYGRWSPSGKSWFANRRSVPGDPPPPQGAAYSYRPLYPKSPTPQQRQPSVVSSEDSEPIITRPKRRRGVSRRSQALEVKTAEVTTNEEAEESDDSSDDSEPIIVRRRRRQLSPIRESRSPTPAKLTVGEYLSQRDSNSPFRETSLASDLYEGVQQRVRRRDGNLRRSRRLNPRAATPPIAARTRGSRASAVVAGRRLRSGRVRKETIKIEESDGEETIKGSPEQSEDEDLTELESESEKSTPRPPPSRSDRQRSSPQPSPSWVRRSTRRSGPQNPPVEPERMTLEEWVDEEDVLELTPPVSLSSGSEYRGG